jgi:DNA-binding transcriptional ArsR family regulator
MPRRLRGDLVAKLSMSPDAAGRHTAKLRHRRFLTLEKKEGRRPVFRLAGKYKTAVHREMHKILAAGCGR